MPAPADETEAYVSPKLRRSQTPAPTRAADAAAPRVIRAVGPIQPRSTASTKKKTTPRSVTIPPVQARVRAPRRTLKSSGSRGFRGRVPGTVPGTCPFGAAAAGCGGATGEGAGARSGVSAGSNICQSGGGGVRGGGGGGGGWGAPRGGGGGG